MDGFPIHTLAVSERAARIARENAIIAKAEANIAAGLGIEFEDAENWLKSLDRNEAAPFPEPSARMPIPGGS